MRGQPGAAGLLIAATECVRLIRPPMRILCRSGVKFVAITSNDQRVVGADPVRDDDKADGSDSRVVDPVIDQAACNGNTKRQLREAGGQVLAGKPLCVLEFTIVENNVNRCRLGDEAEH